MRNKILPALALLAAAMAPAAAAQANPCGGAVPHCNIITVVPAAQPAGVTVAKWNLYKAAAAGGYALGTPYATNTDPANLKFQDNNVAPKQTTHYALTAVSADGLESPFSADLVAVTPATAPAAPTVTLQVF